MSRKSKMKKPVPFAEDENQLHSLPESVRVRKRAGNIFAISSELEKCRGLALKARRLIKANYPGLEEGKRLVDKETGIAIEKAATGSYKGKMSFLTFKVDANGKGFFVKVASSCVIEKNLKGLALANSWLQKRGYKFNGFNVRVILPLQVIAYKNVSYLVTRFFTAEEVKQVSDMKISPFINATIRKLKNEFREIGVTDLVECNAFWHKKTDTILLFDLNAHQ